MKYFLYAFGLGLFVNGLLRFITPDFVENLRGAATVVVNNFPYGILIGPLAFILATTIIDLIKKDL